MEAHRGRVLVVLAVATILVAVGLVVVWNVAPEAILVPALLLVVSIEAIFYVVLYVLERRSHS